MTDELELDSANIFDRLIALIAISSPEVALTMKDGSIKRVSLDVDKILAELQKAKSLVERARRLEREADWLAAKLVCASTRGRSCVFGNGWSQNPIFSTTLPNIRTQSLRRRNHADSTYPLPVLRQ